MTADRIDLTAQLDDLDESDRKILLSDPAVRSRVDELLEEVKQGKRPNHEGMSAADLLNLAREQR